MPSFAFHKKATKNILLINGPFVTSLLFRPLLYRFVSTSEPRSVYQTPLIIRQINQKLSSLVRRGRLQDARAMFDELPYRNTVTWNSMLTGYVCHREITKARTFFDTMPQRDVCSWNLIISGYISCGGTRYMQEARNLFDQMPKRDLISWNTIISGYAKSGYMDEAIKLFNNMPEKNSISWNAITSGFLQNGHVKMGMEFFKRMPERDSASLSALVKGLIHNDELEEAAKVLLEFGKPEDGNEDLIFAYNTLIAGYGHKGRASDAQQLFDQMPLCADGGRDGARRFQRNMVSWNSMIMCYVKSGDVVAARQLFDQMVERDNFTWNTMINGYIQVSNMEEASALFAKMPNPDTLSWNSIIAGYAQSGKLCLALDFFKRIPHKNRVSWNSIIAACEKNDDHVGAINYFKQMQVEGEKPDRHTLSSLLSVCAESVLLCLGMQVHQLVTKIALPDIPLNNSLITMYARCGAIVEARIIFDEMKLQKSVISWNAMIGGYASHGFARQALQLFELMKHDKVRPTYITMIAVLNACAHAGLVDQARLHFSSMTSEFHIEPRIEHFASLVDVIGRYGNVEEALHIINTMPVEPDKTVWGALLGACIVHHNVELAQVAAKALVKLEPESSAPYILLHNLYVDVGRWDDAEKIMMIMEESSIRKQAGFSSVVTGH